MIDTMYGAVCGKKEAMVVLNIEEYHECIIRTRKLSDALLIAQIVTASIEIDEITKQDNSAHE